MMVYVHDKSTKVPRKPAKRTKPRYGDSFQVRSSRMPAYRVVDAPSVIDNIKPFDPIRSVLCKSKELQEVLKHQQSSK